MARYGFGDHLGASPGGGRPVRVLADGGGVWVVVARLAEPSTLMPLAPAGLPQVVVPLVAAPEPTGAELAFGSLWTIDLLGTLRRIDPANGRVRASVSRPGVTFGPSLAAGEGALWATSDFGGEATRIDLGDGGLTRLATKAGGGVAAGEGAVWIGGRDRSLVRLDPASGKVDNGSVWVTTDAAVLRVDPKAF